MDPWWPNGQHGGLLRRSVVGTVPDFVQSPLQAVAIGLQPENADQMRTG